MKASELQNILGVHRDHRLVIILPDGGSVVLSLGTRHTDCLAKESCLPAQPGENCCAGSGCCG